MKIEEILDTKITYLKNYWAELAESDLRTLFDEIKGSKFKIYTQQLSELYMTGNTEMYSIKKKSLPVAAFSATFSKVRTKNGLEKYNHLVVLDIDKLDRAGMEITQNALKNDKYVLCFWKSPSQNGIKALVKIVFTAAVDASTLDLHHKYSFQEISKYFHENYSIELDKSGSDFTRLCFISWDPDFYLKESFNEFVVNPTLTNPSSGPRSTPTFRKLRETAKAKLYDASGKNKPQNKKLIQNIIGYLSKNSKSITFHYDDWIRIAFAIANSFTYDIGIQYFKELSKNDLNKFNSNQCENILHDCYHNSKNVINFVTIIHLAKKQGFIVSRTNREST